MREVEGELGAGLQECKAERRAVVEKEEEDKGEVAMEEGWQAAEA